ncbi:MAG TPA: ATP-dependent zinc metalloprotease FtsH [Reyranella sp.]|nr:ATP-dependent zinc metalloprotease FtsH [Reyranella sp.]
MNPFNRNAALWIVIVLLLALLYSVFQGGATRTAGNTISYSDFVHAVEQRQIQDVRIQGNTVTGTFREPRNGVQKFATYVPNSPPDEQLMPMLIKNVDRVDAGPAEEGVNLGSIFVSWLPVLVLVGVYIFFLRQMQSGTGRAMGFGKSRARLLTEKHGRVTFEDVAGIDEAKAELEEIVDFLKDPQKFQRLGGKIPKGCLLVGPPGTGKTLLARAIAGEANVPFFTISGSDFVEMFVGVGASRVRDMFEQAKKNAPCIVFIDEIDAVGRHRGAGLGGGNDEREQTLNQLLVEMDGFESNEGVILIAATNRPDVLDPALLRPGRFDRQVTVPNPDIGGREKILKVHMRKVPLAPDVDARIIARGTPGFSGADLANLVNEAALRAARVGKRLVTMADFEFAKDKVLMGTERRSMAMTDEEKLATAYHEAGHAIVNIEVPDFEPLHKVTIIPRGRALGVTMPLPERDRYSHSLNWMRSRIAMCFGGRVAERLIYGDMHMNTGAADDIRQATEMARRMVTEFGMSEKLGPLRYSANEQEVFLGHSVTQSKNVSEETARLIDEEIRRLVVEGETRATDILKRNLDKLHAVAKALVEFETLSGEEVRAVMRGETINRIDPMDMGGSEKRRRASVPTSSGSATGTPPGANPEPQPGV